MGEKYRYIGQVIPRMDARDIVTGGTQFLNDIPFRNLLHGKVLRSPHPHAIIKSIGTKKAEQVAGVKAIITYENVPEWSYGNPPIRILDKKVRFVGDAVAIVAAENERLCDQALGLIDVEYEILPAVFDDHEAMNSGAPKLYDNLPGNILPLASQRLWATEIVTGDVEAGFAEADAVAEGSFSYANIPNPISMEAPLTVAFWEEPNMVTVWVSHQKVWGVKRILSPIFGERVKVRVIVGASGGSFGSKTMSWLLQCYAAALSKATGQPVKMCFSKEEQLACFVLRPATRVDGKVGMKKDGTVTAVAGAWILGTGYYSLTTQIQLAVGCGEAMIAIRSKNWNLKPSIVCTNRNSSGIVRGFGGQELKCALIPLLSLAMEKLSLNPFEVLKKNFIKPGDGYYWRDAKWYNYRGIDFSRALDEGAKVFGWADKWKGWLKPTEIKGSKRIGIGVGVHGNADVGEDMGEALVRIDNDGRVVVSQGLAEHGTGQRNNTLKAVAEVLQLPLEMISLAPGDSLVSPVEWGPAGSRGTYGILGAAISGAEDAKKKLFNLAAPMLGADSSEELDTADGIIWLKSDTQKSVTWKEVLHFRSVLGHGRFEPDYTLANCMMSFVEVQVDIETGKLDVLRVVNATDVGQIIDPQGLEGQLNGCLGSAGIDSAVFEETIVDPSTGLILNANLIDYKWRTTAELPLIENVVMETPMNTHRFSAIGVGEISTSPGPSAVLMAASNAIGQWLHEYPVTPERVLKALGKTNREKGEE